VAKRRTDRAHPREHPLSARDAGGDELVVLALELRGNSTRLVLGRAAMGWLLHAIGLAR
jgi:hypothetical protein